MKNPNKLEYRYLNRHWTKPLGELKFDDILEDIINVFGYNEQLGKYVIRQWFSKCYKLDDDLFKPKPKLVASDTTGLIYGLDEDGFYGENAEPDECGEVNDDGYYAEADECEPTEPTEPPWGNGQGIQLRDAQERLRMAMLSLRR